MPPLRSHRSGTDASGRLVTAAGYKRSGDGIDRSVLEAGVAGTGAALSQAASGPGPIQPCAEGPQERLPGRQETGAAPAGGRIDVWAPARGPTTHPGRTGADQKARTARTGMRAKPAAD